MQLPRTSSIAQSHGIRHEMTKLLAALGFCLCVPAAWSQCAPGVPSAGNPGCIPPDQQNSPYYQENPAQQQPAQPQAVWADRWGAIAMDSDTGRAGTVEGQESKSDANRVALDLCSKNGGRNCAILLSFYNQCAAVSQSTDGGPVHAAGAATQKEAEERALNRCTGSKACQIVYSQCSFAERVQ
ncbi:DUF4189 domain-containing protein [Luteibacter rhizovicinus]|uniref:DUF4189 domain-containing protein n=1 Tax=Luteibacter rhizovicinus TaxID=242606 RepID=UPI00104E7CB3